MYLSNLISCPMLIMKLIIPLSMAHHLLPYHAHVLSFSRDPFLPYPPPPQLLFLLTI